MILSAVLSVLWLGILTSISPCPLATNIAAISYIGKDIGKSGHVLISGLFYTLGRTIIYVLIASVLVVGLLTVSGLSNFLQKYMNMVLGPLLIIAGMFLLEMLQLSISGPVHGDRLEKIAKKGSIVGPAMLGMIFALSFCPVSAALFFGSVIPLCIGNKSPVLLPIVYGFGTAVPVLVFALIIAYGGGSLGNIFNKTRTFEIWARRITGVTFILVGIYMSLKYIFNVPLVF